MGFLLGLWDKRDEESFKIPFDTQLKQKLLNKSHCEKRG